MSIKHFVRDSWLSASYYTGLSRLYQVVAGRKRGIISYHNVLPVKTLPPFDTYNVDMTATIFEKQLVFLKKHFSIRPIQELDNSDTDGFFLTIDDGMLNNYEVLVPILEKHGLTGLFAVCPAMIDGEIPHIWRDHFYLLLKGSQGQKVRLPTNQYQPTTLDTPNSVTRSLKKYVYDHQVADVYGLIQEICAQNNWPYAQLQEDELRYQFMNWGQIRDLHQRGHRIASHTMTHRVLRFLSEEEKRYELFESKKRLENQLNTTIDTLVYPYGSMNEINQTTVQVAQEAGYQTALMNVRQHTLSNPHLTHPRFAFPCLSDSAHLYAIASGYKFLFR